MIIRVVTTRTTDPTSNVVNVAAVKESEKTIRIEINEGSPFVASSVWIDTMISIGRIIENFYALVLLHLPSPLAPGAIQVDRKSLEHGILGLPPLRRIKPQTAQRGVPADVATDGVHRQGTSEEPRGIRICFGRCLWRILECGERGCLWWRRNESERRGRVKEGGCGLGKHEGTVL
jgi:hypothetical protein